MERRGRGRKEGEARGQGNGGIVDDGVGKRNSGGNVARSQKVWVCDVDGVVQL